MLWIILEIILIVAAAVDAILGFMGNIQYKISFFVLFFIYIAFSVVPPCLISSTELKQFPYGILASIFILFTLVLAVLVFLKKWTPLFPTYQAALIWMTVFVAADIILVYANMAVRK